MMVRLLIDTIPVIEKGNDQELDNKHGHLDMCG